MNFVTSLIKYGPYKELLLSRFPKPVVNPQHKKTFLNSHPSITGHAFEIFFLLLNSDCTDVTMTLASKTITALEHLSKIKEYINDGHTYLSSTDLWIRGVESDTHIYLSRRSYSLIEENFSIHLNKKSYAVEDSVLRTIKIGKLFGSPDYKHVEQILHNYGLNPFSQYALIDIESAILFLEEKIIDFKIRAVSFLQTKRFTPPFLESLLYMAYTSSPYFSLNTLLKTAKFTSEYVSSVFEHFKVFKKSYTIDYEKFVCEPRLHQHGILATPDFLVDQTILELKTSQKFFPLADYLQVLTYLLFAQHPDNIERYGKIQDAKICYSLYNEYVPIGLDLSKVTKTFTKQWVSTIESFKESLWPGLPVSKRKN